MKGTWRRRKGSHEKQDEYQVFSLNSNKEVETLTSVSANDSIEAEIKAKTFCIMMGIKYSHIKKNEQ